MFLGRLTRQSSSVTAKLSLRALCHHHMLTASSTHQCCGSDMKAKKIFSGCIIGMTLATNSFADIANKSAEFDQSPSRLYLAQAQLDTSEAEVRLSAEHNAKAKAAEDAKAKMVEDAKAKATESAAAAKAQSKAIEIANASPVTSNYAEIVNSIDDLIIGRVVESWARPPSARNGMVVVLQVEMVQDGTMRSVNVAKSSGDAAYDNSVVAAVKSIGRLSEMQELKPSDFQPYRSFKLTFTPEDLTL
jgi:colicin import membrane protein